MTERLECAIAGSFKFKPEIDNLHTVFAEFNVTILEPSKGWLFVPTMSFADRIGFRPLPEEAGMQIRQIEDRFLAALKQADFLYIYNEGGYIGLSTAFEIGCALSLKKPIYAKEPLDFLELSDGDIEIAAILQAATSVASPEGATILERAKRQSCEESLH